VHLCSVSGKTRAADRADEFEFCGIEIERSRIDVDKLRPESEDARHLWNGPERESGKNDLGIARQIERLQRLVKRHAAIRCGKRMLHAVVSGNLFFEFLNRRTAKTIATENRFQRRQPET